MGDAAGRGAREHRLLRGGGPPPGTRGWQLSDRLPAEVARSLAGALAACAADAAGLARALVAAGTGVPVRLDGLAGTPGGLRAAASDFQRRRWIESRGAGTVAAAAALPREIAAFLEGVAAMAEVRPDRGRFRLVVTPPPAPSAFSAAIGRTGLAHVDLLQTAAAMADVARSAQRSLTVLTPFANETGLDFVANLFRSTPAAERTLVLRRGATRPALAPRSEEFVALGVDVRDYTVRHEAGYETFHAKVVLADSLRAYVGSANMLHYARHSLELGALLDGRDVEVLAAAVRAIVACSARAHP